MAGSLIIEIIGFVVVIVVLWRYVAPRVRTATKNQQNLIRGQITASEEAAAQLANAQRKYEDAVAEARVEAAKIRDGARADAQRIVVEMREQAEREIARIKQRGEDDLVQQRQQVIRELRTRIGELSVDLASRLVTEHVSTEAQRAATVDLLLGELEEMAGTPAASKGEA
ncbi:MAG TPA: F0F1 ATP synthase subunit B [Pseudonocardiaceae bacterium]|jgi:ATP synthase F0 subunit b